MNDRRDEPSIPDLGKLPRDAEPPPALEQRVVAALRSRNALSGSTGPSARRRWWGAAAAALLFVAGLAAGRLTVPEPSRPEYTHVLLLREGPGFEAATGAAAGERVSEYARWALDLRQAGIDVSGEKLGEDARLLRPGDGPHPASTGPEPAGAIGGFFLLRAGSLQEAIARSRECPHLRHGGTIEVRPIDPT